MRRARSWIPVLLLAVVVASPALAGEGRRRAARCEGWAANLQAWEAWEALSGGDLLWHLMRGVRRREIAVISRRYANRCVHLNQVQVLGSHNSYHIEPSAEALRILLLFSPEFIAWEYTHRPLDEQFSELGIRQIELDVFYDPDGGLYSIRKGLLVLEQDPMGPEELLEPGMKVLHVQDLDFDTRCLFLVDCLETIKAWSDAHPRHLPLMVLLEAKDEEIPDPVALEFAIPLEFDSAAFRDLDAEIRSVFPEEQLITPDDVRGNTATLEEAVLTRGWPTLGRSRGRVLFALDNGSKSEAYRDGRASLEGRVLFTNSTPGDPDAAFVKANDPEGDPSLIPDLVSRGYLVRTRADADTQQARTGDTARRDAALSSGAQYVSSDYPEPDPRLGTGDYMVAIPGGAPARCNPINSPPGCRSAALETRP